MPIIHKCHQHTIVVTDYKFGNIRCCSMCGKIKPVVYRMVPFYCNCIICKQGKWVVIYPGKHPQRFSQHFLALLFAVKVAQSPMLMRDVER